MVLVTKIQMKAAANITRSANYWFVCIYLGISCSARVVPMDHLKPGLWSRSPSNFGWPGPEICVGSSSTALVRGTNNLYK